MTSSYWSSYCHQECWREDTFSIFEILTWLLTFPWKWTLQECNYLTSFGKSYLLYWEKHSDFFFIICQAVSTLRPRQNDCHFADNVFKRIFLNENIWIVIKISPKFVRKGPINDTNHYLNQWWSSLLMHICVTRPQWVKNFNNCLTNTWNSVNDRIKGIRTLSTQEGFF